MSLYQEKLAQAADIVARAGVDAWLTFTRETSIAGDPVLPLLMAGGLTWSSALIVFADGRKIAIVGSYDADPLRHSGDWDEVVPYVQGIREPLQHALKDAKKVAINFSLDDVMSDGLTHGMYRQLRHDLLPDHELVSAASIVAELRGRKTTTEVARMRAAIAETDLIFEYIANSAVRGMTERELYDLVQKRIDAAGYGYAWDRTGDPIVNFGPDSMIGHGIPSPDIRLADGQILHIDLGIIKDGYASDIQRCWFVGESIPTEVQRAFDTVNAAISAGAEKLRPGVAGYEVDAAARELLVAAGYDEYLHALGHQVGRIAHDGGGILGPRWERYGATAEVPVQAGQVYTLELGIIVPGRGYLGLEEMVRVGDTGLEWLSERQLSLPLI